MEEALGEGKRLNEVYEINRRFLDLIALQVLGREGGYYGLPAELCLRIAELEPSQRDAAATVPMLLVTAARQAATDVSAVHDRQGESSRLTEDVEVAAQRFTASLLTWLIQDAQQNHSLSSLWLGGSASSGDSLRNLSFGDIQVLALYADKILAACFTDRPQLWNDLIHAARTGDPQLQARARLAALSRSCPPESVIKARGMHNPR